MKHPLQVFNFSIQNAANDAVDIHIDGFIVDAGTQAMEKAWFGDDTSVSFRSFRNQINEKPVKTYNIYINSGGGVVTDAMAMHDFIVELQNQGKTVNTIGRGIVGSAATFILMASKNAEMSKNSWMMIHNVSGGFWGNVNEAERFAATLRQFNDRARDFYAEYTKMSKEEITDLMNDETWMTAETAEKKGFIKSVSADAVFTNKIPKEQWQYSDTSVLNAYNSAVKMPPQDDHKSYIDQKLDDMKNWIKNALGIKDTRLPENADQQAVLNAVVDGLIPRLEEMDKEMETEIQNRVNDAIKGDAFKNAVKVEVEAVTKNLKQTVADLTADVTNKLGQPTITPFTGAQETKTYGSFVNE